MKTILLVSASVLTLAFVSSAALAETVCGQAEASVSSGTINLNIANRTYYAYKQQNFAVQNPMTFDWTAGNCVCVEGVTGYDPEYDKDYLYKTITVSKKISEDVGDTCAFQPPH